VSLFGRWIEVAKTAEFAAADRKTFRLADGRDVALFKVGGEYFAVSGVCTHAFAPMAGGIVEDHAVECPLHGARFDLRTGRNLTPPAVRPLAAYEVKVEGDAVRIKA
jgi:3-phenylpropionate/trans-cinnamate dioxygenase ferredoxin subunit